VSLVYRNDDGVDADTLPPRLFPDQQKQGQVFCPGFFPHHSPGTRGNRPDPAPLLVQSAASLQCCALVVTRARHHGSTEAAFGAVGTRQTGAMPGSTQPLPRDRHLSAVCVTVPFSIGMDACHARSGRAMIERRLFSIAAGGTSCFGDSQPSEIGYERTLPTKKYPGAGPGSPVLKLCAVVSCSRWQLGSPLRPQSIHRRVQP
jgi:hypothetical protein